MEKYYCDHCRILYNEKTVCENCGALAQMKIKIEVQNQEKSC